MSRRLRAPAACASVAGMKTLAVIIGALLVSVAAQDLPTPPPEWDDVHVLHVNTEKPHATMMIYPSVDAAKAAAALDSRQAALARSPWFMSLNGTWKFKASPRPSERPAEFFRADFDDASWGPIAVPGSVE